MSKHSILCSEAAIGNVVENQFKSAISKESVFSGIWVFNYNQFKYK